MSIPCCKNYLGHEQGSPKQLTCNKYAVQRDTKSVLMSEFYSALMLARHVSDLIGPSSGAFCTSCICRLCYVVIRELLDTSSRYEVLGRTESTPSSPHNPFPLHEDPS